MAIMKQFIQRALLSILLTFTAGTTWATDYVITYTSGGITHFMGCNGSAVQDYTTFDPTTCIWSVDSSNDHFSCNGYTLQQKDDSENKVNVIESSKINQVSNPNTLKWHISTEFETKDNVYYETGSGVKYFIYLDGTTWKRFNFSNPDGSTLAKAYEVSTESKDESMSVSVTGENTISEIGSQTYTSTATYQAAYTAYFWNDGTGSYGTIDPVSVTPTLSATGTSSEITFNASTGVLSVTALPANTTSVTITATASHNGFTNSTTKTVKILGTTPSAPTISNYLNRVTITAEANSDIIYYTTDETDPTTSTSRTLYAGPFEVEGTPTIKAIAVRGTASSSVATYTLVMPSTGISEDGTTVILMDWEDIDNWTYYTGVDKSVDATETYPDGYYNTKYNGLLYSPNARNIVIEYRGGSVANASPVAISAVEGENQNTMIYYLTLEKDQTKGNYPYTVIPNPFSKRPRKNGTTGTNGFYGFGGWKIVSGGERINEHANGEVLDLEEKITFSSDLATGDEIVLEATWVTATVKTGAYAQTFNGGTYETNFWVLGDNGANSLASLEQNMTISTRYPDGTVLTTVPIDNNEISVSQNFTGTIKLEWLKTTSSGNVYAKGRNLFIGRGFESSSTIGKTLSFASGTKVDQKVRIESGKYSSLTHYTSGQSAGTITKQEVVLGCDYDRAIKNNDNLVVLKDMMVGNNLSINVGYDVPISYTTALSGTFGKDLSLGDGGQNNSYYYTIRESDINCHRILVIKGGIWKNIAGGVGKDHDVDKPAFTFRMTGGTIEGVLYGAGAFALAGGIRRYVITGGEIQGWIAAGCNGTGETNKDKNGLTNGDSFVYIGGKAKVGYGSKTINDVEGGNIFGAGRGAPDKNYEVGTINNSNVVIADNCEIEKNVYGGGNFGLSKGEANIYITGGTVEGSVFGGANMKEGYSSKIIMTGGQVKTGVYGGCNTQGTIKNSTVVNILGGTVGENADNKKANICGGGYGKDTRVAKNVSVEIGGTATVYGDVYGGSEMGLVNYDLPDNASQKEKDEYGYQSGKKVNVTVSGGYVVGDVYGGGLGTSTIAANTYGMTMVSVTGGEVQGRVFGCNNVNGTPADDAVEITMTGGTVGGVYGGGNLAPYNGSPSVTIQNGNTRNYNDTANGNVYGGGYGVSCVGLTGSALTEAQNAAVVSGNPTVTIGDWQPDHKVVIGGSVFGGGGLAAVEGNPTVTINDCETIIEGDVYGGGDAAPVYSTNTTIWGGLIKGNVFAGGNGSNLNMNNLGAQIGYDRQDSWDGRTVPDDVSGNVVLNVYGGTFGDWNGDTCKENTGGIFGGSNERGDITGKISLFVGEPTYEQLLEAGASTCSFRINELYGAGNKAEYKGVGGIECRLGCLSGINNLYGGAKNSNITADVNLTITNGTFQNVFGGNNLGGNINGQITINIDETGCQPIIIGNLYGCGNKAPYTTPSGKNDPIINVYSCSHIGNIFGGGLGEEATVTGNPMVNIFQIPGKFVPSDTGTGDETNSDEGKRLLGTIGNVYGGGDAAKVIGTTTVNIATKEGTQQHLNAAEDNADVNQYAIGANITGNVYGGGNEADVTGKTTVNVGKK